MAALEVIGRVVLIYVAVLVLLRLGGKKELGSLTPMDLLTMLLLSETVSPAMVGGSDSVGIGLVAATTLIALSVLVGFVTFRSRRLERIVEGTAKVLIRDGKVDADVMRGERLTHEQLLTALHENGLMSVAEVKRAFVEPSGDLTFIEKK
jgi:uncharacterized membrane protein YcaP (DUF421 family)